MFVGLVVDDVHRAGHRPETDQPSRHKRDDGWIRACGAWGLSERRSGETGRK